MNIAVVLKKSGLGLMRDAQILEGILAPENKVEQLPLSGTDWVVKLTPGPFHRLRLTLYSVISIIYLCVNIFRSPKYDLAIYLESFRPWNTGKAKRNVLIPNQEWLSPKLTGGLNHFDEIWCKTQAAVNIFSKYHNNVHLIGFSSEINAASLGVKKEDDLLLHRAGNSLLRGTKVLLETWLQHPEWPKLSVIIADRLKGKVIAGEIPNNIEFLQGHWNDQEFSELMASAAIHLHPTETEGYGLAISEALGYGCLVMATDAEPMNELVTADRGVLLASRFKGRHHLGNLYSVLPEGIESAMKELLAMSESERKSRMSNARAWFLDNQQDFKLRLVERVRGIHEYR